MRFLQEEEELERPGTGNDTEITLGMKSLLGVFFGLVLICGVFFGLGYSLGRGNSSAIPAPPEASNATRPTAPTPIGPRVHEDDNSETSTYTPGPDAREPINTSAAEPAPASAQKPSATPGTAVVRQLASEPEVMPVAAPRKPTPSFTAAETEAPAAEPAQASASTSPASTPPSTAAPTSPSATAGTPSMVQVAAISRQEDAEILVAALKKRGYGAVIRNDPKDSLLHVQIGPFTTRDQARAMRAKLLADGYNAILK